MTRTLIIASVFAPIVGMCQVDVPAVQTDSVKTLAEVVVHGYANDRPLSEIPAAIGSVSAITLNRFNNTSFLQSVNTIPGVRMEERSPGSYRFAIRGSSLRSPFGIRNVKMYWNGLPLTDGSGNTYLNLVDFNSASNIEVIKGPGGSLYGAGTGGVVLLKSPYSNQPSAQASVVVGSYGLQRYQLSGQAGSANGGVAINAAHQESTGYREHTNMQRDAINADIRFKVNTRSSLSSSLFYTDLYYQTPGGLTKAQYDADARQARPTGATPGAVDQKAAVYNKTFYGGLKYEIDWSTNWSTYVGVLGSWTDFTNPTLRNYEKRKEYNWGGRMETQYRLPEKQVKGKVTFGAEYQNFDSPLTDYDNNSGVPGNIQTDDRLYSYIFTAFGQADLGLPSNYFLTLGGSGNFLNYKFKRVSVSPEVDQERSFSPVFSPRIALLKKLGENWSAYGSFSHGFSPPSLAEVRPSTGTFNNTLAPETGNSYEIGVRSKLLKSIVINLTVYDFELNNAIVVEQQISGADYFQNAGNTSQKGLELWTSWTPALFYRDDLNLIRVWGSYSYNHYRFEEYVQNNISYSGNKLTGVAPHVATGGVDIGVKNLYANVTMNYVDKIPLNDGNTAFASAYFLAGIRGGYRLKLKKASTIELFVGGDNLTGAKYSLGNDLNAAGGRYYNVAAGRNYFAGMKARL